MKLKTRKCKMFLALAALLGSGQAAVAQDLTSYNLFYYDPWATNSWIIEMTNGGNYMTYSLTGCVDLKNEVLAAGSEAACGRATDYYGNPVDDWFCRAWGGDDTLSGNGNSGWADNFLNVANRFTYNPNQEAICIESYFGQQLITPFSLYQALQNQ